MTIDLNGIAQAINQNPEATRETRLHAIRRDLLQGGLISEVFRKHGLL